MTTPTVRELLTLWLVSDIPLRVSTQQLDPQRVYAGQNPPASPSNLEVQVKHRRSRNLGSKTGKPRRHEIELRVRSKGTDQVVEQERAALVSDIADELVDAYDGAQGGRALFVAGLPGLTFGDVAAARGDVVVLARSTREVVVELFVKVWEE